MEDIRRLLTILQDVKEDVDFAKETALVDDGLIDSLDVTAIVAEVYDVFHVRITGADIDPSNFNSAESLLRLIERIREKP